LIDLKKQYLSIKEELDSAICRVLSKEQEQILLGTLMGDSGLHVGKTDRNAGLQVSHRAEDGEYLMWKYRSLRSTGLFHPPTFKVRGSGQRQWILRSKHHSLFTSLYNLFYAGRKKVVPQEVLYRLGPLGLAVWYQDDGCLMVRKGRCHAYHPLIRLSTESFSQDEALMIRDWLISAWDVPFRVCPNPPGWRLALSIEKEVTKFLKLMGPHVVPCMKRKVRWCYV